MPEGNTVSQDPGKNTESADPSLRRRMLDAAQRLVDEDGGLTVSLEHLTLDRVIKEAGASRTSVYRIWASKDDFNSDLLKDLAGPSWQGTAAFDDATIRLARDTVAENLGELSSAEGRRRVLLETIRLAANQNFEAVISSAQWRTYVALSATVLSMPTANENKDVILSALRESEQIFLESMAEFYEDMSIILGLKLKSNVPSFETLAAAGAAVVEGLGLRHTLNEQLVNTRLKYANDGDWHLASLAFLGIFDQLIEPVPDEDYSFPQALSSYLKRLAEREEVRAR